MPTAKKKQKYPQRAIAHLEGLLTLNKKMSAALVDRLTQDVSEGKSLFVFGSGHSALFALELYHRAGGAHFVIPVVADFLLPSAGPPAVRAFERNPEAGLPLLRASGAKKGEMLWIASQSGINGAVVEIALEAKRMGLRTVAFTSKTHSRAVQSRHPSGKRLMEVCDEVIDLAGEVGDAAIEVAPGVKAGALSNLGCVFLGHSILTEVCSRLEKKGLRCVYTSVNTPDGEKRNVALEKLAALRDPRLR